MEYLEYPKDYPDARKWPVDIAKTDTHSLRLFIKWQYPKAFKPEILPITPNADLVDYLTDKGHSFGAPYYAEQ